MWGQWCLLLKDQESDAARRRKIRRHAGAPRHDFRDRIPLKKLCARYPEPAAGQGMHPGGAYAHGMSRSNVL
jgi:hypothetical protein